MKETSAGFFQKIFRRNLRTTGRFPEIFNAIQTKGNIAEAEMRKVFNMGVGIAMIVHPEDADAVLKKAKDSGIEIFEAGRLING